MPSQHSKIRHERCPSCREPAVARNWVPYGEKRPGPCAGCASGINHFHLRCASCLLGLGWERAGVLANEGLVVEPDEIVRCTWCKGILLEDHRLEMPVLPGCTLCMVGSAHRHYLCACSRETIARLPDSGDTVPLGVPWARRLAAAGVLLAVLIPIVGAIVVRLFS